MTQTVLIYYGLGILVTLLAFIPGLAILALLKLLLSNTRFSSMFEFSGLETLSLSFGFSFLFLATLSLAMAHDLVLVASLALIGTLGSAILLIRCFKPRLSSELKLLLLIFSAQLLMKFFLQTIWEYPASGGDWYFHAFSVPNAFSQGNWTPSREYTPLFSIIIYSYDQLLGISPFAYWFSQLLTSIMSSAFLFPAYLIAREKFGPKIARFTLLFMVVNPFLVESGIYSWPKLLVAYFVLQMIYLVFVKSDKSTVTYAIGGIFGALAFWSHNAAALFILTAVLIMLFSKKFSKRSCLWFLVTLIITVFPYFIWQFLAYGSFYSSRLVFFPLVSSEGALSASPGEIMSNFFATPLQEFFSKRLMNVVFSLTPWYLTYLRVWGVERVAFFYYYGSYPGVLTLFVYLLVAVHFLRYVGLMHGKQRSTSHLFVIVPYVMTIAFVGYTTMGGGIRNTLHTTIPLLILFAFSELFIIAKATLRSLAKALVFVGCAIEGIIYAYVVGWGYSLDREWVLNTVLRRSIPESEVSKFVSAHFFVGGTFQFIVSFVILSASIVVIAYIARKTWLELDRLERGMHEARINQSERSV